ncbi:MAG: hypothetical protein JW731_16325 [Bacteroidales bacterium]|nr:hypothetical protein [Bacteroidales bacterium]
MPWKFVPTGNTGKVELTFTESDPDYNKFSFVTSNGIQLVLDDSGDKPLLTLPAGEAASDYHVFALYKEGEATTQVGRLHVRSESEVTYPVTLAPMATGISTAGLADELNQIYAPYAVKWEVALDESFIGRTDWDVEGDVLGEINTGDAFLSVYSPDQKMLNSLYKDENPDLGLSMSVVFIFNNYPVSSEVTILDGAQTGDMPIKKRWGYLFGSNTSAKTLAHELGHGKLTFHHPFDDEYCGNDFGITPNLMDYGEGIELNRFQWEASHNPAIIGNIFQDDEDGALAPLVALLIKAGINGIADFGIQVVCNYYFNPPCADSWSKSMEGVNWLQVIRSAIEGAIPWKPPGGPLGKAAITASADVAVNSTNAFLRGEPYGLNELGIDFAGGFISQLAGDGISELMTKYGSTGLRKGLKKIGFSDSFISKFLGGEIADAFTKIRHGLRDINYTNEVIKTADEINTFWKSVGYVDPPYKADLPVCQIQVTESTSFVRVYAGDITDVSGQFVMKLEAITNTDGSFLTSAQIKEKFALKTLPKFVADAEIPAGTLLNCGITGPNYGEIGGGLQFDLNYQMIGNFTFRTSL